MKQLHIVRGLGFDDKMREDAIPVIRGNLLQAIQSILTAMIELHIEFHSEVRFQFLSYLIIIHHLMEV